MYTISFILGIIVGIIILRILQLDAKQKIFNKLNKDGNIHITPNTTFTTKT